MKGNLYYRTSKIFLRQVHYDQLLVPGQVENFTISTPLTLYALINSSFRFDTINFELAIVYIKGPQVIIFSKGNAFLSLKIVFVLTNSVDTDEMPHNAAFHLGLSCFC